VKGKELDLTGQQDLFFEEGWFLESSNAPLPIEKRYYRLIRVDGKICVISPLLDYFQGCL
jgi:hypothetical protein